MERPSIDEYWTAIVPLIASRGTCPRRRVGAILTDEAGKLVSTGYNGSAPGAPHCDVFPCPGSPVRNGERADCESLHAELNALLQASYSRRKPHTLYCSLTPCFPCAKALLTAGVRRVVALERYAHDDSGPRFLERNNVQVGVLSEVGR